MSARPLLGLVLRSIACHTFPMARSRNTEADAGAIARWSARLLPLLLGGLLLGLSVPRLMAEIALLPGNPLLDAVQRGARLSAGDLQKLMESRRRALAWSGAARLRLDLASIEILAADSAPGGGAGNDEAMARAAEDLRSGLARAPADPEAWTRLAYAEIARGQPARRIAPILAMAIETAPVAPELTFARLELCLVEWPYLPQPVRALVDEQIRIAWRQSGERLVALAAATGRKDAVREALAQGDRAAFDGIADHAK